MLATLALSAGTPMLLGGDELGHTQHGNNNAYSLDDETSWRAWRSPAPGLVEFTERAFALRRDVPELRRTEFFYGRCDSDPDTTPPDVSWLSTVGRELGQADWHHHRATLVVRVESASALLLVLHAGDGYTDLVLPSAHDTAWTPVLDTATATGEPDASSPVPGGTVAPAGTTITVPGLTFLAFRAT